MILSGFAGGAVFILALTILLVLCMKKRRGSQDRVTKKPDVMADVDKASADRTSYISDLKLDLKNSDDRCNPVCILFNTSLYF